MAILKDEFLKLYNDTHRKITGVPADETMALENYRRLTVLKKLSGSEEGVPIFSNTIDKSGSLNWTYWPNPPS